MPRNPEQQSIMERVTRAEARLRGHHIPIISLMYDIVDSQGFTIAEAVQEYIDDIKLTQDMSYVRDLIGTTLGQEQSFKRSVIKQYTTVMDSPHLNSEIALLVGMKDDICLACQGGGVHCGQLPSKERATDANMDDGNCIRRAVNWIEAMMGKPVESHYIENRFILQAGVRNTRVVFTTAGNLRAYIKNNKSIS